MADGLKHRLLDGKEPSLGVRVVSFTDIHGRFARVLIVQLAAEATSGRHDSCSAKIE